MKLQEGAYENVITGELQQDMVLAEDGGLVCKQEDIDNAEYTSMLVDHVSKIIHNRLSDDNLSSGEKTDFINQLIDFLGEGADEQVVDDRQMLAAVVSKQEEARLVATNQSIVRPLTGFRTSNLFTGGQSKVPLNAENRTGYPECRQDFHHCLVPETVGA